MLFWVNSNVFPDPIPEFIQDAIGEFFGLKFRHLQKLLAQHEIEYIEFRKLRQFEWALYLQGNGDGSCVTIDSSVDHAQVQKYVLKRSEFELRSEEVQLYLLFHCLGNSDVVLRKLGMQKPAPDDFDGLRKFRQSQIEAAARYAIENINIIREYRDSLSTPR